MKLQFWNKALFCGCLLAITACSDEETVNPPASVEIPEQPAELAEKLAQYNSDVASLQLMVNGEVKVVDYSSDEQHNYTLELSDGKIVNAALQTEADADIPMFAINADGYWEYQLGGEKQTLTDLSGGNPVPARKSLGKGTFTPQLALGEDGCWQMSLNGMHWKKLSDTPAPSLEGKTVASYSLFKSVTENEDGTLSLALSGGDLVLSIDATVSSSAQAWKKFFMKSEDNVLLDYSYAGYNHGESAPADGFAWGYKVINVRERMENDNLSAREALNLILYENKLVRKCPGKTDNSNTNATAKIVIYFPAGDYDLQPEGDTDKFPEIYGGNFVIKGDGEGKTRLLMNNPIGTSESTTAPLLTIKHTNSPTNIDNSKILATVAENAAKGSFSVKVGAANDLSVGKWVQLRLRSGNDELLAKEVGPMYGQMTTDWSVAQQPGLSGKNENGKGVNVMEFHQIKSIDGNVVTFYEPIMHEVNTAYNDYDGGWVIREYKYFENVGVEDLSFIGKAITPYYHHGEGQDKSKAWLYDSGYVPLQLNRVVNSWVRNVSFESVSEAITFGESANCSAYNITITGNRGHSAVRAQGSSRVFIGKVQDESADSRGHGQWHGCGVSKPSIGTVVWNCNWGQDACFESHATQPRATLFDNCRGGLVRYHAGGAEDEAPNHLADLTLWNLYVTGTVDEKGENFASDFKWWDAGNIWWKIYPPIVVGTHGNAVTFSKEEGQVTYEESTGTKVTPESLYEAQLERRLGYVPAWLNMLK